MLLPATVPQEAQYGHVPYTLMSINREYGQDYDGFGEFCRLLKASPLVTHTKKEKFCDFQTGCWELDEWW